MAGGAFNSASAGTVNGLSHVIPSTSRAIERCWLTLRQAHRGATATGPLNKPGVEPSGHPGNGSKTGRARVRRVSVSIERESTREFWPYLEGLWPERRRGRPEDRARRGTRERRRVCCKSLWLSGICGHEGERPAGGLAVNDKALVIRGRKRMAPHLTEPSPGQSLLGAGYRRRENGIALESNPANRPAEPALPTASLYTRVPVSDPNP